MKKKKKKKEKEKNLFEMIPQPNENIRTELCDNGNIQLVFPRFKSKFMMKYFVPKNKKPNIYINLEEHGTAVWNLIDGKRNVKEIAELLADHFNNEENYQYRVSTYMTQLYRSGFIKFAE